MEKVYFIESLLTFYLKGSFTFSKNAVVLKDPNTIFGIIPFGAREQTIPVNQIASVHSSFKLEIKTLLVGIVLALIGFNFFSMISKEGASAILAAVLFIALGASNIISAFQTIVAIQTTGGLVIPTEIVAIEKSKADQIVSMVNDLIMVRMNDTNTKDQTDRVVDAINNK